jgi:hypothetical protein
MNEKNIIDDIKYLEKLGLSIEEILENITATYQGYERLIVSAFKKMGYDVTL